MNSNPDDPTQSQQPATPPGDPDATVSRRVAPGSAAGELSTSRMIGPYKLLQQIGEGGMGEVWMAEQEKPVRRRVALKLIKAGADNKQIIARFEAERQALAMMDHQNIAKVLDAGTTENGQPYFVMELVQGIPFTKYCDQNKLSINERLELFIPVCQAIQHAHQKGIIHRDIKPSNVLVSLYDGKPVPKVIDFGLAKALQHQTKLTDKTMFTEFGQVVGTLQYMSPEQAEMNQLDIDTRTDIYSLGVMMYELLTGSTPIDADTLKQQAILQVLASIREKDPPRPSLRLSSSTNEAVSGISAQRQIDPSRLKNILRGELDWIVMKALEKDRTRRYDTATGFAQDIDNYLSGNIVTARPPSTAYQVKKYIRKHRGLVTSLATIVTLLIASLIAISWFAINENQQRSLADARAIEVLEEKHKAELEAKRANDNEQIAKQNAEQNRLVIDIFTEGIASKLTKFQVITMKDEVSDVTSKESAIVSRDSLAKLQATLGFHLRNSNAPPVEWGGWFLRALEEYQSLERDNLLDASMLFSYSVVADNAAYYLDITQNIGKAIQTGQQSLRLIRKLQQSSAARDLDRLREYEAKYLTNLGNRVDVLENYSRAIEILLAIEARSAFGDDLLAKILHNRAAELSATNLHQAEADCRLAIELFEKLEDFPSLQNGLNQMLLIQTALENEDQYQVYLQKLTQMFPDDSDSASDGLALAFFNDAMSKHTNGNLDAALTGYEKVINLLQRLAKESAAIQHQRVYFQSYWHRGEVLVEQGKVAEAVPDFREALAALLRSGNPEFLEYIPYLSVALLECYAHENPVLIANLLEPETVLFEGKETALVKLAAIYVDAARADRQAENRDRWINLAVQAIAILKQQGLLTEELLTELRKESFSDVFSDHDRWNNLLLPNQ